ncbi:hypothetical protein AJ79_07746 [Helicocarpus griseus UAMH5409]|uniref:Uncharacterized protein n=1 Tax=Helicocarpus griseus UAMH5409 TaxID=1447875 RepID=A0A2B7X009_9EURO|nr:hypothetical protein AJ79_07746 [Helicocarpus griseus UAMH5409]
MNGYPGGGSTVRPGDVKPIPYTPISSMGRELGIMFGFIALSIVTMMLYWYFWQAAQRRNAAKEAARRDALNAQERLRRAEKEQQRRWRSGGGNNSGEYDDEIGRVQEMTISWAIGGGRMSRSTRNGTSTNGFGFGDTTQGLIV